jgi:uncharacterized protein YcbX
VVTPEDEELFIKVENFRPNLTVSTLGKDPQPHQEDSWKSVSIPLLSSSSVNNNKDSKDDERMILSVNGPCSRCSMVNVNGNSGIMSCKVFEALKEYRKVNSHVYFGQFLSFQSFQSTEEFNEAEEIEHYLQIGVPVIVERLL